MGDVDRAGQVQLLAQLGARAGLALGGDFQHQVAAGLERQVGRQPQVPGAGALELVLLGDDLVVPVLDPVREGGGRRLVAAVAGLDVVLVGRAGLGRRRAGDDQGELLGLKFADGLVQLETQLGLGGLRLLAGLPQGRGRLGEPALVVGPQLAVLAVQLLPAPPGVGHLPLLAEHGVDMRAGRDADGQE